MLLTANMYCARRLNLLVLKPPPSSTCSRIRRGVTDHMILVFSSQFNLSLYSLHLVLIDIFSYGTMTKSTKCAYQSKCNIDFLLVLQYLTERSSFLVLFITTVYANSKYSYHFLTFKVLKYSYQK